jgi:hypothetical protein
VNNLYSSFTRARRNSLPYDNITVVIPNPPTEDQKRCVLKLVRFAMRCGADGLVNLKIGVTATGHVIARGIGVKFGKIRSRGTDVLEYRAGSRDLNPLVSPRRYVNEYLFTDARERQSRDELQELEAEISKLEGSSYIRAGTPTVNLSRGSTALRGYDLRERSNHHNEFTDHDNDGSYEYSGGVYARGYSYEGVGMTMNWPETGTDLDRSNY